MAAFLLQRLLGALGVLCVVAVLVFVLLRLTPGDPAAVLAGDFATEEDKQEVRKDLGLDRPLAAQFVIWFRNVGSGDLGRSYSSKQAVTSLIAQRLEPTLALALCAISLAVLVAVPLGVFAAWRHGGWVDRVLMGCSTLGFSVPVFVLGYGLSWLFSLKFGWLPVQGYHHLSDGFGPFVGHLILPSVALSAVLVALIARVTRAAVSEALTEDYVRTARAKGLTEGRVVRAHALANAAVPIVTVIGSGLATLMGGVVVTERVFGIPGLGDLVVVAVTARDFPTVQGVVLLFSVSYVTINFLIDLTYPALDPRIRF
jgi:peptide/nickel transport system permease protein